MKKIIILKQINYLDSSLCKIDDFYFELFKFFDPLIVEKPFSKICLFDFRVKKLYGLLKITLLILKQLLLLRIQIKTIAIRPLKTSSAIDQEVIRLVQELKVLLIQTNFIMNFLDEISHLDLICFSLFFSFLIIVESLKIENILF